MKYKVVILDCDGVILDSNNLKTEAFKRVLGSKEYDSGLIRKFIMYHKKNGGVSRYEKFKVFIKRLS